MLIPLQTQDSTGCKCPNGDFLLAECIACTVLFALNQGLALSTVDPNIQISLMSSKTIPKNQDSSYKTDLDF